MLGTDALLTPLQSTDLAFKDSVIKGSNRASQVSMEGSNTPILAGNATFQAEKN